MFLPIKPVSLKVKHVSILNLIVNPQKQPFNLYYRIVMEILYYTGKLPLANYDLVEYAQKLLDRFNKTLQQSCLIYPGVTQCVWIFHHFMSAPVCMTSFPKFLEVLNEL